MKTNRKIIQIAISPETDAFYQTLVALCDDGSVWMKSIREGNQWIRQESIPQEELYESDRKGESGYIHGDVFFAKRKLKKAYDHCMLVHDFVQWDDLCKELGI